MEVGALRGSIGGIQGAKEFLSFFVDNPSKTASLFSHSSLLIFDDRFIVNIDATYNFLIQLTRTNSETNLTVSDFFSRIIRVFCSKSKRILFIQRNI